MLSNEKWFGASAGFYPFTIDQSIRITNNGYLNMSTNGFANAPSLSTKGTLSFWIKVLDNADRNYIFMNYSANNNNGLMYIQVGSANDGLFTIPQYGRVPYLNGIIQRDFSNWYHFVVSFDSTSSTASERLMKIYENGTQVTTGTFNAINQNDVFPFTAQGSNNGGFTIGRHSTAGYYTECILAEINLIDGQSLDASYFGEFKNGTWIPKEYTGTYGNNGCRFTFASSDFNTSGGAISDPNGSSVNLFNNGISDASGSGNHLNINSVSTHDILPDSPTNNFATLNFLAGSTEQASSEGNLRTTASSSGANFASNRSTIGVKSGKWYAEFRLDVIQLGTGGQDNGTFVGTGSKEYPHDSSNQNGTDNGVTILYLANSSSSSRGIFVDGTLFDSGLDAHSAGDIIGIEMNVDDSEVTFYKNGTKQGNTRGIGSSVDGGFYYFYTYVRVQTASTRVTANFGQDSTFAGQETAGTNTDENGIGSFKYAPSSGYLALCSSNLPDTTLSPNQSEQADDHFNTVTYSGNGSNTHAITGVGFQPDWLWIKVRNQSGSHYLADSSRGLGTGDSMRVLMTNGTIAEYTSENDQVRSFDADGFTIDDNTDITWYVNRSSDTYVSWNWKAGGTTPTKTYKVVVVSDSGNKYRFRNSADSATFAQSAVTLDLQEGGTYVFDWSDSSAQGHPIRFSLTANGTHGGGSEYTTGVVKDDSAYKTTITVASGVATLYYYCQYHSGMGGQINTNTTHGSTNFDGSILSVSQTNETAGFSILTYTGTGSNATIGHGLGVAPSMVITKVRNTANNWGVYHSGINDNTKALLLDTTGAATAYGGSTAMWNNTAPTSTVFSVGTNASTGGSANYVAYVFAEVEGYSKFGSYTGNNSTDGTFIYTGFRPAWIMVKRTNGAGHWLIFDNKRNGFNPDSRELKADSNSAETDFDRIDFVSNGLKQRFAGTDNNGSSDTYIYMAFAEQPFKFSNAR